MKRVDRSNNAINHHKRRKLAVRPAQPHYTKGSSILIVGDGDFSFSKALLSICECGQRLIATSFDDEKAVFEKYANAKSCIQYIKTHGAYVLHRVDATQLDQTLWRVNGLTKLFDYVIFNFPHTGQQRVHLNRNLLRDFFQSARTILTPLGEVHITLKNRPPYSNWQIEKFARDSHYLLKARQKFDSRLYPGYQHRTTDPLAKFFETELCTTYIFIVNRVKFPMKSVPSAQLSANLNKCATVESDHGTSLALETSDLDYQMTLWKPWHHPSNFHTTT
uniref:Uncharacterized protein AlNc14C14G1639 n=1 Tax=Albugo laibachii Nc14 TaxID=890382 RepID=F0W3R3_9STRA|nr:conserved hypothetical protein [Albugo laibachii Nc14]|eukprot:CCA15733.1 conserved hypothetical protein [Albugo laibachii Nc14]